MKIRIPWVFCFVWLTLSAFAMSEEVPGRVSDEIETVGGHLMGFSNGGAAATSSQGSIRANPAMLVFERKYEVGASYHWPTYGREFYQASVIDSQTSSFAAGASFVSFRTKYKSSQEAVGHDEKLEAIYDSSLKYRVSVAFAHSFSNLSAGIGLNYINAADETQSKKNGATVGLGLAGLLTPTLRAGVSVENLGNKDVKNLAPVTYRGGLAYLMFKGDLSLHLDYRQRQRVASEYVTVDKVETDRSKFSSFERMMVLSTSVRIQDLLRLIAGYGMEVGGKRSSLSGGVALVNKSFSCSYLLSKPYLKDSRIHQAVNLEIQMSI